MATVLVVDDDEATREFLGILLRPHRIVQAADALTALGLLATDQEIAVAIVDRYMPEHDGLWLIARIRAEFPAVAMILVTGDDSVPPRFTLQPGVVGYLVKPVDPELLVNTVCTGVAWHKVAARNKLPRVR